MINIAEKKQDDIVKQIVFEVSEIPLEYLQTLHAIIHSFRTNLPTVGTEKIEENVLTKAETIDWDILIDEIHTNRKRNNKRIFNRINDLIVEENEEINN